MRTFAVAAVFGAVAASAFAQDVKTDFDKEANFTAIKTFDIKIGTAWNNELGEKRVLDEIAQALTEKGWTRAEQSPDAVVVLHPTVRPTSRRPSTRSTPAVTAVTAIEAGAAAGWAAPPRKCASMPLARSSSTSSMPRARWRFIASARAGANGVEFHSARSRRRALRRRVRGRVRRAASIPPTSIARAERVSTRARCGTRCTPSSFAASGRSPARWPTWFGSSACRFCAPGRGSGAGAAGPGSPARARIQPGRADRRSPGRCARSARPPPMADARARHGSRRPTSPPRSGGRTSTARSWRAAAWPDDTSCSSTTSSPPAPPVARALARCGRPAPSGSTS